MLSMLAPHPLVLFCELPHNALLGGVGVLILINEHILEAISILAANILMLVEQHKSIDQQIVKIHRVRLR